MRTKEIIFCIVIILVTIGICSLIYKDNQNSKEVDQVVLNKTIHWANSSFVACQLKYVDNSARCNIYSKDCVMINCFKENEQTPYCFKVKFDGQFYYDYSSDDRFGVIGRC